MSDLPLACDCGTVTGILSNVSTSTSTHVVCYCDDCQAFAHALGRAADVLDPHGGTDIVQLTLAQVAVTGGREHLRSLRLARGGILRWYASCCRTPLANTVSPKLPFVGLVRRWIDDPRAEEAIGPIRFRLHGRFAQAAPAELDVHPKVPLGLLVRVVPKIIGARLRGASGTAFFGADGRPVATPTIASEAPAERIEA